MTTLQKIGQLFFPAVFINDTEENYQYIDTLIRDYHIGGLTFFHSRASAATNYEANKKVEVVEDSFEKLQQLVQRFQKVAKIPLLISIDAEWGLAMRVENTPQYPYAITLGALPETESELVFEIGKQTAHDLKCAGVYYNLAPLADVNNNPNNPVIGYRSFGQDKAKVAHFANHFANGLSAGGVLNCLKHFPGHGNTQVDSHLGLPILPHTLQDLYETELHPFIEGIKNGIDSIMIGHLAVPSLHNGENTSATLSKYIIKDLLRKQLNFNGLVISDALNMRAISELYPEKGWLEWIAFDAGNDVLCFSIHVEEGIQKILENATESQIEESWQRIKAAKEKVGLFETTFEPNLTFDWGKSHELNQKVAQNAITEVFRKEEILWQNVPKEEVALVQIYPPKNNVFETLVSQKMNWDTFSFSAENGAISTLKQETEKYKQLVVALFVPKAKPLNNFDIQPEVLELLNHWLENRQVHLYLFGNPYSAQVITSVSKAQQLVIAYQNLESFQEKAALQLIENEKNQAQLPVILELK